TSWSAIPGGPEPATTRPGRLIQMRKLAMTFEGYIGTPAARKQELRLLPQPIYRFPEAAAYDGAVFAYAQATDPEILLLVRADSQAAKPAWEFAAARMTIVNAF